MVREAASVRIQMAIQATTAVQTILDKVNGVSQDTEPISNMNVLDMRGKV